MTSTPRRTVAAALALPALALPLALGSPAHAADKVTHDKTHEKGVPAYADLVKDDVDNAKTMVRATVKLRQVVPNRSVVALLVQPAGSKTVYAVGNDANGKSHHAAFEKMKGKGDAKKVACKGLRVTFDRSAEKVRIEFPQSCLGQDAGTAGFQVLTADGTKGGSGYDLSKAVTIKRG